MPQMCHCGRASQHTPKYRIFEEPKNTLVQAAMENWESAPAGQSRSCNALQSHYYMVHYGQEFQCQQQQQSAWHHGPCCCRCYVPPRPESDDVAVGAPWPTWHCQADWHFGTVPRCYAGIPSRDPWVDEYGQHKAQAAARVCETSSFQRHASLNKQPQVFKM